MEELQQRIGYTFKNRALLELALTAPAYRMDHPEANDNQRLEFLGDAVFGILSAEALYRQFPDDREGELTVRRTRLASGVALAAAAEELGIERVLRRNRGALQLEGRAKPLADAMEALLGAIWLDGGVDAARAVYARLWPETSEGAFDLWRGNPKGHLQVLTQAMRPPRQPVYEIVSAVGPSHAPDVTVRVSVKGVGDAVGKGRSHREAESAAAAALVAKLEDSAHA